jgi:hypothetical protein
VYGRSLGAADFFELSRAFARLGELRLARHAGGGARAGGGGGGNEDGVTRAAGGGGGGGDGGQGVRVLWGVRDSSLPEGLSLSDLPLGPNTRVVSWCAGRTRAPAGGPRASNTCREGRPVRARRLRL